MISREEAIKRLEGARFTVQPYLYMNEAFDMAIEALKRLTPQKPNLEGDGYADGVLVYDTWICPNCEKRYEVDYDEYDHCPNCGQAIDWGDSE